MRMAKFTSTLSAKFFKFAFFLPRLHGKSHQSCCPQLFIILARREQNRMPLAIGIALHKLIHLPDAPKHKQCLLPVKTSAAASTARFSQGKLTCAGIWKLRLSAAYQIKRCPVFMVHECYARLSKPW